MVQAGSDFPNDRTLMLVPRRLLGAALVLALTSGWLLALPERAYADSAIAPKSGSFTVRGSGFGHGWGMSQYGAYGAARSGLSWEQILGFYYPGTKLTRMPSGTTLRSGSRGDNDGSLRVRAGQRAHRVATPTASASRCRPARSTGPGGSAAPAPAIG